MEKTAGSVQTLLWIQTLFHPDAVQVQLLQMTAIRDLLKIFVCWRAVQTIIAHGLLMTVHLDAVMTMATVRPQVHPDHVLNPQAVMLREILLPTVIMQPVT
jgi:hypothetical protein